MEYSIWYSTACDEKACDVTKLRWATRFHMTVVLLDIPQTRECLVWKTIFVPFRAVSYCRFQSKFWWVWILTMISVLDDVLGSSFWRLPGGRAEPKAQQPWYHDQHLSSLYLITIVQRYPRRNWPRLTVVNLELPWSTMNYHGQKQWWHLTQHGQEPWTNMVVHGRPW